MASALENLENCLLKLSRKKYNYDYYVPSKWNNYETPELVTHLQNPYKFFRDKIKEIRMLSNASTMPKTYCDWSNQAVVYNMFVRYASCFDHNRDKEISITSQDNELKETGTFLKSIALLPYIKKLGVNTIYLLPITSIGKDGMKGNLGSPYAIRNPYKLDENLAEDTLDLTVEEQFKAFVEACHLIGMKVVVEFVFRTASIDSDLALEHPEWFYWIKETIRDRKPNEADEKKYGTPIFYGEELSKIYEKVEACDFTKLPAPHQEHKDMFVDVPKKIARVGEKIIGVSGEIKKMTARIPGAFADWPPDDNQPPWSDVTYLRLYGHPSFNYIAYNTVRMYENRLTKNQYKVRSLWDNICEIIPFYQQNFDIDGVMIDMGHALPSELRAKMVDTARKNNPNFIFWEENFVLSHKSVKDGYNAVVGYLLFDMHNKEKVHNLVKNLSENGSPIPFFGTSENHNTHRTAQREGDIRFSKFVWAFSNFVPSIPFIHNGFELGENTPVNTGLDFSDEEIKDYPVEKLPLFSVASLNWDRQDDLNEFMSKISKIREKKIDCKNNFSSQTLEYIETKNQNIIAFIRIFRNNKLLFIGNMNPSKELYFAFQVFGNYNKLKLLNKEQCIFIKNDWLIYNLKPFDFIIGDLI